MKQFAEDESFREAHDEPEAKTFDGKGKMIEFPTPDGKTGSAYAIMGGAPSNQYLIVIHEWWGLNDHIKEEADTYYEQLEGVNVMALDLYDGKVADNRDDAAQYMQSVSDQRALAIINGALQKAGADARIGTIGWCFGGGWSLRTAIEAGDNAEACIMYYGMPVQKADVLAKLKAPILGIFGTQDDWINPEVVEQFQALAQATNTELDVHSFDAAHAFANPSNPKYDAEATREARKLTLDFLRTELELTD